MEHKAKEHKKDKGIRIDFDEVTAIPEIHTGKVPCDFPQHEETESGSLEVIDRDVAIPEVYRHKTDK